MMTKPFSFPLMMVSRMPALLLLLLMLAPASSVWAQSKKQKLQKREHYEFASDIPVYVEQLKQELTYPLAWGNSKTRSFKKWKKEARAKVLECMMTPPKAAADFGVEWLESERRDGYTAHRLSFWVNAYSRITAYLLVPDGEGPFPAVNLLHDHGAHLYIGKEKMIRPFAVDSAVVKDADQWAQQLYGGRYVGDHLARQGYVVFSADAPMWGERGRKEGVDRNKYDIIAGNMMMLGRDLSAFMTYDDMACTRLMTTLPCIDAGRIACMGCSMGAYRAWMLAAVSDDICASVAICWMVTTDVQLSTRFNRKENGGFANCIPGLRQWLDYPHIASLACPKPALFINGRRDHLFPVPGAEAAFQTMRGVWESQNASDVLETELWDVPHSCGLELQDRALLFLDKHLKKVR